MANNLCPQTLKPRKDEKNSLEVYGNRSRRSSMVETSGKGMLELPTFPGLKYIFCCFEATVHLKNFVSN